MFLSTVTLDDQLIAAIKHLADTLPLEQNYTWEMPNNLPLQIPEDVVGAFRRNVYLKENLAPLLQNDEDLEVHYWIIREWGGIRSFQRSELNNQRISEFRDQLRRKSLRRSTFNLISSVSKLAAFWDPQQYSIYDSRAVFALNWLIFCHSSDRRIFPQPLGRSSAISQFDTGTLFRLSGIYFAERNWKTAYHEYCELLRKLSREALGQERPYWVEMLLFVAAPRTILEDIQKNTTVTIKISAQ
jgi:hypothetical protein